MVDAEHYHEERNNQGLGNELIESAEMPDEGEVIRDERLGGLLSFYRRARYRTLSGPSDQSVSPPRSVGVCGRHDFTAGDQRDLGAIADS